MNHGEYSQVDDLQGDEVVLRIDDDSFWVAGRLSRLKNETSLTALRRWVKVHGAIDHHYQAAKILTVPALIVERVSRDVRPSKIKIQIEPLGFRPQEARGTENWLAQLWKRLVEKSWN